ncbi:chromaffin granule amine transporter-like [Rhinophrynus dorsalis]
MSALMSAGEFPNKMDVSIMPDLFRIIQVLIYVSLSSKEFIVTMVECAPCQWLKKKRESPWLVLVVVTVALVVDYMLFTVVVPIMPSLLYETEYENGNKMNSSTSFPASSYSSFSNLSLNDNSTLSRTHSGNNKNSSKCYDGKDFLKEENLRVGLFLSSKGILQIITNPLVGLLINRIGYDAPLFIGCIILFLSTLIFAFVDTYVVLILTRCFQGIGSAFTSVAGLGLLAHVFTDDYERGKALGYAATGVAIGVLDPQPIFRLAKWKLTPWVLNCRKAFLTKVHDAGAPFGSTMYEFVGKSSPFLVLALLALLDGAIQLCILRPSSFKKGSIPPTPYLELLSDPYIIVAAGMAFLPAFASYIICINIFAILSHKMGRWLCSLLGLILMAISVMCLPLASNFYQLIAPNAATGIAFGMVESSMLPVMAHLVDLRHTSVYGGIYAISDMALSAGYVIGPSAGGAIAKAIAFKWLMVIFGVLNIAYAPLLIFLRNPPAKEENKPILNQEQEMQSKSDDVQDNTPTLRLSDTSDEEISTSIMTSTE